MKKQKKQNLLTFIIVILVIALAVLLGTMAYEEAINMNKNQTEQTSNPETENEEKEQINDEEENKENVSNVENDEIQNNEENNQETTNNQENKDDVIEEDEEKDEPEYVGVEETQSNEDINSGKTIEEKAIDLAKKEWGNDASVTFNIEEKKGNKYYVSVKRNAITACWYEVDIETWEISEY